MTRETIYSLIFELDVDGKNVRTNLNAFGSLPVQALPTCTGNGKHMNLQC